MHCGANLEDASDAVQDALLLAYQKWPTLRSPAAYVRTVARNAYLQIAQKREAELPRAVAAGYVSRGTTIGSLDLGCEFEAIISWLQCLPMQQRAVMALDIDGFEDAEIAQILGILLSTVRSHRR